MKKIGGSAQSAIWGWLVLNRNELTWTALLGGVALFIAIYISP